MRTRYTLINMVVNVGGQLMNQVLLFISRMVFIHYLSAAYLGVNGLFTDVLGILNLAELGIGTAMITACMSRLRRMMSIGWRS